MYCWQTGSLARYRWGHCNMYIRYAMWREKYIDEIRLLPRATFHCSRSVTSDTVNVFGIVTENPSKSPGEGTQVQRGAAPSLRISRKKGSFFKTSACPRFCKRRVLFCTQVQSMGVKIPLQSTKYTRFWRRVTQGFRVCCRHLLPLNK